MEMTSSLGYPLKPPSLDLVIYDTTSQFFACFVKTWGKGAAFWRIILGNPSVSHFSRGMAMVK